MNAGGIKNKKRKLHYYNPPTPNIDDKKGKKLNLININGRMFTEDIISEKLKDGDFEIKLPGYEVEENIKPDMELEFYSGKLLNLNLAMFRLNFELPLKVYIFQPILLKEVGTIPQIEEVVENIAKKFNKTKYVREDFITALKNGNIVFFCDNILLFHLLFLDNSYQYQYQKILVKHL